MNICRQLVRKYDYETFLSCLFLPQNIQKVAFAIKALNVETARIKESSKSETLQQQRMEFWLSSIEKLNEQKNFQNPILDALAECKIVNPSWLQVMINARKVDLLKKGYFTIADIEDYSEKVLASQFYLLMEQDGIESANSFQAASHLAKSITINIFMRGSRELARNQKINWPIRSMAKFKVTDEMFYEYSLDSSLHKDKICHLVAEVAEFSQSHLSACKSLLKGLNGREKKHFMQIIPTQDYLTTLERKKFQLHEADLSLDSRLLLKMWWKGYEKLENYK